MRKTLIELLKEHKKKEVTIETTLERIEAYKKAMEDPNSRIAYLFSENTIGMPKRKGGLPNSPVEGKVCKEEGNHYEKMETLKVWIEEDLSRIHPMQIEVEQINTALNALTKQQNYIVECKYFEKMYWREIEVSFNNRFNTYVTSDRLKQVHRETIDVLYEMLKPYCQRVKLAN